MREWWELLLAAVLAVGWVVRTLAAAARLWETWRRWRGGPGPRKLHLRKEEDDEIWVEQ
jgi:hypothetical protein